MLDQESAMDKWERTITSNLEKSFLQAVTQVKSRLLFQCFYQKQTPSSDHIYQQDNSMIGLFLLSINSFAFYKINPKFQPESEIVFGNEFMTISDS